MLSISKVRITVPKIAKDEIVRKDLINAILNSDKLTYIHAGAGYGKTTLLSQVANFCEHTVWLSIDGESDLLGFTNNLCEAIRLCFPVYDFSVSEYIPFENDENFITILGNALICAIEKLESPFVIIMDDLHTVGDIRIKKLIANLVKYKPHSTQILLSSRESPWLELVPQLVRGNILEFTHKELKFTQAEFIQLLEYDDTIIYNITEGWPLAIRSFKVLLENGASLADIRVQGNETLYSYLFYECISRLPTEVVDFLRTTACFENLDAEMLTAILDHKNTKFILKSLAARNLFTIKIGKDLYRYHTLFREYLLDNADIIERLLLFKKAALFYYGKQQHSEAINYAILSHHSELIQDIISINYKAYITSGKFSELRGWFNALDQTKTSLRHEVLVAKGAFLSCIGNFSDAKTCFETVIPLLDKSSVELYIEAMIHKARVLRNFESFEESTELLDELISGIDGYPMEMIYDIVIEKLYNLCWNSQIREANILIKDMIEQCAQTGDFKTRAWFERYMTTVHFFAGRMREAIEFFEESLRLPVQEQIRLDLHSICMYAAKAYQLMGDQGKAMSTITIELQKLRSAGRFEEMWAAYVLAAEINYHAVFINRANGGSASYETTIKYFTLADEYAPLYRRTEFQKHWTKMHRLMCSLLFSDESKEAAIEEILVSLPTVGNYLKSLMLGRLFSYYATVGDLNNAVKFAKESIEIGENSGISLIAITAYGLLAMAAISLNDSTQTLPLTKRYMELSCENGVCDFFRIKQAYGPLLEFAFENRITPEFTTKMINFGGHKFKKAYIWMGGFSVYPYKKRAEPIKMRTKKERELLAFLLDAGSGGATKEGIIDAIWFDSESDDIRKLIGVNLAQIKRDLAPLGMENPILYYREVLCGSQGRNCG